MLDSNDTSNEPATNGSAWAATLAGAIGGFAFAVLTVLSEASVTAGRYLQWYRPAGSMSGVAAMAILLWAMFWIFLHARWRNHDLRRQTALTVLICVLVVISIIATFPPVYELL